MPNEKENAQVPAQVDAKNQELSAVDVLQAMQEQNAALQAQVAQMMPKKRQKPDETKIKANVAKKEEILQREADHVHAVIWVKKHDPDTGKPLFEPFLQKFNQSEWYNFLKHPNGYSIKEMIHLPDGIMDKNAWEKDQVKKEEERKARLRKAGQKA